jgi:hypothetical protein
VILIPAPFLAIEVVEQGHPLWIRETLAAQPLAHVSPVLLLAVSIVALAVGAAARPRYFERAARQVFVEGPVEELTAVVTVEAPQGKGNHALQLPDWIPDGMAGFVPYGAVLRPPAEEVGKGEGIDVIAARGVVAMGDGVHGHSAGLAGIGRVARSPLLKSTYRRTPRPPPRPGNIYPESIRNRQNIE